MGTMITAGVLILCAAAAVRQIVRDRKNGKRISCGGDCSRCSGHCH